MEKDIHLNIRGDLEVGWDGDLAYSTDDDVTVDNVIFRLKTYKGNYALELGCGASLEDIIGEPNIRYTGELCELMIKEALTHDGFIAEADLDIRVSPLTTTTLVVVLTIAGLSTFNVAASLDLKTGALDILS